MIRRIFAVLALATAFAVPAAQAQMYNPDYPVCLHVFGSLDGERMDCIFTSIPQCQATASGRSAMCLINPYFAGRPVRRRY
jgi:hypothetical protein